MNLLQVHNYYRERGGEDVVVEEEYNLLKEIHNVYQYKVDNQRELSSLKNRLKLLLNTHYAKEPRRQIHNFIGEHGIELMHVHNFFPLLSPSIFDAARQAGIPSVMTLHNYRLIYPNGQLYHDGSVDLRSVRGSAWQCVPQGVYRNSIIQTAVVSHMIEHHRKRDTWLRVPTLFIALTHFAKRLFVEGGLPANRIAVKPNFMKDPFASGQASSASDASGSAVADKESGNSGDVNPVTGSPRSNDRYFLYAGRISQEKGIRQLIDCWMEAGFQFELRIIGEGPDADSLKELSKGNSRIKWLGWQSRPEVLRQLSGAQALVFPSRWYEGFPMILVEAMAAGCPVITSSIGSQAEIIEHEETGLHFNLDNPRSLSNAIGAFIENEKLSVQMGRHAREAYLNLYTPERNLKLMSEVYRKARELEVRYQASAKFRS